MNRTKRYWSDEFLLFRRAAVKRLPDSRRTSEFTARLAKKVLDCAATGAWGPIELKIAALSDPCIGARRCQA
jgi:hypothetical protein